MIVVKESVFTSILILIALSYDHVMVSAQGENITLVRTEPDPTSQELPCANQIIVYECQQLISSSELAWTLPNNEALRFTVFSRINDTEPPDPSDDDNYIATLTNKTEGDLIATFLFTSTLMILEPVNGSTVTCTGGTISNSVSIDITIIFSGPPDPPTDLSYDNTVIIESSVDLQWNRPSYTGGVPIVNYIVSIDGINIMNTSNEMITLTLPENINDDILVVAINLCGLESEPATNTIPTAAPTNIISLSIEEFSCSKPLDPISVNINWEVGNRSVGIIYPPVTSVSVELSESNDIFCSDMTVITNCIGEIKDRDDYTVIITQTNNIGSTVYTDILDARIVTMEDYSESDDELSVNVTINELCLNDTDYLVQVIFGTRPSVNDDCMDQEESVPKNISSGDSETFVVSIDSVTLEDGYMYCYTIIVNGARVTNGSGDGGGKKKKNIIAIACGVVVGIGLLVGSPTVVIFIVWKKKLSSTTKKKKNQGVDEMALQSTSSDPASPVTKDTSSAETGPTYEDLSRTPHPTTGEEGGENGDRNIHISIFICCKGRETDDPASPVTKDTSSAETGPTYEDPNSIKRTPHPTTGEVYTDVNLDKKNKKQGNTTGAAVYQDPNTIEHEIAPSGEEYAMPQTKGKKKKKAIDNEGASGKEMTEEEKAALYSVPDRKRQKAKSAGLTYADIDIKASARPAPPSQGSQYVQVKHD